VAESDGLSAVELTSEDRSTHRRYREVIVVWVVLAILTTLRAWPDLRARTLRDTDDGTRLLQLRQLFGGQDWWDLTIERVGVAPVESHWSRHMDSLLALPMGILKPVIGEDAAELAAIIIVPLVLLAVALWLVSSIARLLSADGDVALYAVIAFGMTAAARNRLGPGGLDHHGIQIVLVLITIRLLMERGSPRSHLAAGIAAGVSMTVGLEMLPILAGVVAGVGIRWALGSDHPRYEYQALGTGLVASTIVSSVVFSPPSRLLSLDCDVMSLGFFGLVAIPALALALAGGRDWPVRRRWGLLLVSALVALAWFGMVSPTCVSGPYGALPKEVDRVWLDLIGETEGLIQTAVARPVYSVVLILGPVVAINELARRPRSRKHPGWIPLLLGLVVAFALIWWQQRQLPIVRALAAPPLGVFVVRCRQLVSSDLWRAVVGATLVVLLSGSAWTIIPRGGGSAEAIEVDGPCLGDGLLDELGRLRVGLVAAEVDLGPTLLLRTDHRVLSVPNHRAYEGVLATYEIFIADPPDAKSVVSSLGVDYILVCSDSPISGIWSADNTEGLLAALLEDNPPQWLSKVIDAGRSRVYAFDAH
jgi:hypothetical protein